jgi:5'-3' exonuclease
MRHLLIDGRNSLYRALFAGLSDKQFTSSGHHPFLIFIHFTNFYIRKFKPDEIHIFWDDKTENLWRRRIYPAYKAHRTGDRHGFDVNAAMNNMERVARMMLPEMGIRMYKRDTMEADDLIYAFILTLSDGDEAVVVSSDSDLRQLEGAWPGRTSVTVYDPMSKKINPTKYIVLMKCLMGDKADNISGYPGIGPKRASVLCDDGDALLKFMKLRGAQRLIINRAIIDLAKCPLIEQNVQYIVGVRREPTHFSQQAIHVVATALKVRGIVSEFHRYILPFKDLMSRSGANHATASARC